MFKCLEEKTESAKNLRVGDDVLSDVSMSVEAGQKIAVCGRTGRYD